MNKPNGDACIEMLGRLVAFDTTSVNSNLEMISYMDDFLKALGIESRLTFNEDKSKANLWATIGPKDKGGIVLSGHTDVVPVKGQEWSSDPFKMVRCGSKLYGRGTSDMKGFIACAMAHAGDMAWRDLETPIHFAFSYDEEIGCLGVRELIKDMAENLPLPVAVIVGEPTLMQIIGGNKGGRGFITKVHGVDGHSSQPALGANAIMAAARIASFLEDLQKRLRDNADPNNGFVPPYTTIDLGLISGGTAHNIIPALCEFNWGFRGLPTDDIDALEAEVRQFIDEKIVPSLKTISPDAGVTTTMRIDVPALLPDDGSPAESLIRHLTGLNQSGRVSYGTEAGRFQKAGVPGVIFGPGSIEQAHIPDEFIEVEQMEACSDFIGKLVDWAEG
jgi:acetylornithine deacetylase